MLGITSNTTRYYLFVYCLYRLLKGKLYQGRHFVILLPQHQQWKEPLAHRHGQGWINLCWMVNSSKRCISVCMWTHVQFLQHPSETQMHSIKAKRKRCWKLSLTSSYASFNKERACRRALSQHKVTKSWERTFCDGEVSIFHPPYSLKGWQP